MRITPGRLPRRTRLARALGLDRSPLRRASDRAEAWIRIGLLAVFLIAGPIAALSTGGWAYRAGITAASVQPVPSHPVSATVLRPSLAPSYLNRADQQSQAPAGTWRQSTHTSARAHEGSGRGHYAGPDNARAAGRPAANPRAPDQTAPGLLGGGLVEGRAAVVSRSALNSGGTVAAARPHAALIWRAPPAAAARLPAPRADHPPQPCVSLRDPAPSSVSGASSSAARYPSRWPTPDTNSAIATGFSRATVDRIPVLRI